MGSRTDEPTADASRFGASSHPAPTQHLMICMCTRPCCRCSIGSTRLVVDMTVARLSTHLGTSATSWVTRGGKTCVPRRIRPMRLTGCLVDQVHAPDKARVPSYAE